jgi:hypothetical protein
MTTWPPLSARARAYWTAASTIRRDNLGLRWDTALRALMTFAKHDPHVGLQMRACEVLGMVGLDCRREVAQ